MTEEKQKYSYRKKLQAAKLLGKIKPPMTADGEIDVGKTKWLYDVYGVANDTKKGVSDYGEWTALMGDFLMFKCDDALKADEERVIFRAGQLFLPDIALNLILAEGVGEGTYIEFGFRIGVIGDEDSVTNFVYTCEPLMKAAQSSPVENLIRQTAPNILQIEDKSGSDQSTEAKETPDTASKKPAQGQKSKAA